MIMGGMAALFTLVIVFTAWKLHHIILSSLYMRFDNAELVASVSAEKARVDQLNRQLTAEIAERQRAEDALRTVLRIWNCESRSAPQSWRRRWPSYISR
jgi:C4-dicarboxylate-specific signal transduction histidine kinase